VDEAMPVGQYREFDVGSLDILFEEDASVAESGLGFP
jgi:hypothetical protein